MPADSLRGSLLELDNALHRDHRLWVLFRNFLCWIDPACDAPAYTPVACRSSAYLGPGLEPAEAGVSTISLAAVERTMCELLARTGRPVVYRDPADGSGHSVDPQTAASPVGFLPALLVAGEAVWRETTGKGFGLDIVRDPDALLGFRLRGIGAGTFATVMLASIEAINQVAQPDAIVISDVHAIWSAATARMRRERAVPTTRPLGSRS
jgi:hypothetical protein